MPDLIQCDSRYLAELEQQVKALPAPVQSVKFQRDEILKHVEFNKVRINAFEDLINGMKRSNELFKGVLEA